MSEQPDGLVPYYLPDAFTEDADGNTVPVRNLIPRRIADVTAEAGFGPVPERIEITADFCQCPACKGLRCEP